MMGMLFIKAIIIIIRQSITDTQPLGNILDSFLNHFMCLPYVSLFQDSAFC